MLDKIKEEPQGVAVVDLLRPEGVLVLVKYSAKITCFYFLMVCKKLFAIPTISGDMRANLRRVLTLKGEAIFATHIGILEPSIA